MVRSQIKKHWNIWLQIFFVILSLVTFSVLLHGQTFIADSLDDMFHWGRIVEITQDLRHGDLPQFDGYTGYLGLATATFYPWLSLVPVAIINMFVSPLMAIRSYILLVSFTCLNVAYWSALSYWHNRHRALLFSVIVYATPVFTDLISAQGELSGMLAVALLPMAFFGWLSLMKNGHWHLLAWGLILLTFTHLITTIMSIVILSILILCSWRSLDGKRMKSLIKAGVIWVITTASVWLPAVILSKDNPIDFPHLMMPMNYYAYLGFSRYYLAQTFYFLLGITNVVGIILGFMMRKHLTYYGKRLYLGSVICLALNIQYLPWHLIGLTPYQIIQFPYRTAVFGNIMLMISITPVIGQLCHRLRLFKMLTVSISALSLIFCIISLHTLNDEGQRYINDLPNRTTAQRELWSNRYLRSDLADRYCYNADYSPKALTTYQYSQDVSRGLIGHSRDNYIYSNNLRHQQKEIKPIDHGFMVDNTVFINTDFKLPITVYKGQTYKFYCNGKRFYPQAYQNSNPVFKNMPAGSYRFAYRTPVMAYRKVAIGLSLLGACILLTITMLPNIRLATIDTDEQQDRNNDGIKDIK